MGRSPSLDENGLKRGPWTPEEDEKLIAYIKQHGHGSWRALPKLAGLNRCGKSCRLRWTNYLRPDIKRGKFSQEEEQAILNLHSILGNKWSAIASHLPGRTDNEIKNFWNTHLKKKLIQMGFDPVTHMPRTDNVLSSLTRFLALANLQDLLVLDLPFSLEEQAALKQQADTLQMAKLQYLQHLLGQPPPPSGIATFQPLQYDQNMSVPFAHLPNLEFQEAPDDQTTGVVHYPDVTAVYSQSEASTWLPCSSSNSPPLPPNSFVSNGESESSPSAWSELLLFEDPLFHEIDP